MNKTILLNNTRYNYIFINNGKDSAIFPKKCTLNSKIEQI